MTLSTQDNFSILDLSNCKFKIVSFSWKLGYIYLIGLIYKKVRVRFDNITIFNHSINTSIRPHARADLTVHAGAQDVGDAGQAGQRG